eukprot:3643586-Heterocapsa_arctica.AAC.1
MSEDVIPYRAWNPDSALLGASIFTSYDVGGPAITARGHCERFAHVNHGGAAVDVEVVLVEVELGKQQATYPCPRPLLQP